MDADAIADAVEKIIFVFRDDCWPPELQEHGKFLDFWLELSDLYFAVREHTGTQFTQGELTSICYNILSSNIVLPVVDGLTKLLTLEDDSPVLSPRYYLPKEVFFMWVRIVQHLLQAIVKDPDAQTLAVLEATASGYQNRTLIVTSDLCLDGKPPNEMVRLAHSAAIRSCFMNLEYERAEEMKREDSRRLLWHKLAKERRQFTATIMPSYPQSFLVEWWCCAGNIA